MRLEPNFLLGSQRFALVWVLPGDISTSEGEHQAEFMMSLLIQSYQPTWLEVATEELPAFLVSPLISSPNGDLVSFSNSVALSELNAELLSLLSPIALRRPNLMALGPYDVFLRTSFAFVSFFQPYSGFWLPLDDIDLECWLTLERLRISSDFISSAASSILSQGIDDFFVPCPLGWVTSQVFCFYNSRASAKFSNVTFSAVNS